MQGNNTKSRKLLSHLPKKKRILRLMAREDQPISSRTSLVHMSEKKEVPFSMAIGNGVLMQECFPKHLRMGTATIKKDKETDEHGKKRGVSVERIKAGMKEKEVPKAYRYLIKIQ